MSQRIILAIKEMSDEFELLKKLVEELAKANEDKLNKQTREVDTVTTLWCVLFVLILLQKAVKIYLHKEKHKHKHKDSSTTSNTNSSECV